MSEQEASSTGLTPAQLASIPRVYANGLGIGYSKTECALTFMLGNEPQVAVLLPFSVAKTLSAQINLVITDFEKRSGQTIPRAEDIIVEGITASPSSVPPQSGS